MGLTHVPVTLKRVEGGGETYTADFLVDSGAIDSLVPAAQLKAIGVKPEGEGTYRLADESVLVFTFGFARIEVGGEVTVGRVIFGPDNAEPLLGVTALESAGFTVDPATQKLKKLPAISLK